MLEMPTLYIPHGGGPCFFMKESFGPPGAWDRMEAHLRGLSDQVGALPSAILVISAHWEESRPTVLSSANPPLLYDYYGFPDYTYRLQYGAPGSPELARRTEELLIAGGIDVGSDHSRGFDHGVFIPFMLIYPDAQIPIVQLSLRGDLDPAFHRTVGGALAPLRKDSVLIVGSGMSYHNLRGFFAPASQTHDREALAFDAWLNDAVTQDDVTERHRLLDAWKTAPGASTAHPREDHLIPLMVAAGAAPLSPGRRIYADTVMGKPISSFMFS